MISNQGITEARNVIEAGGAAGKKEGRKEERGYNTKEGREGEGEEHKGEGREGCWEGGRRGMPEPRPGQDKFRVISFLHPHTFLHPPTP